MAAIKITETNINPKGLFVSSLSRYADSDVIYWGDLNKITFKTYKKTPVVLSDSDRYMVVGSGDEFRPDKISKRFYGDVGFWWKILEVNGIKDIFDFKIGTNIRLPANIF